MKVKVDCVSIPLDSKVSRYYDTLDFADAYSVQLPKGGVASPETLAALMLAGQATWVKRLMTLRDVLVCVLPVNISTTNDLQHADSKAFKRIGFFKVYESNDKEIIMGEDDHHLDFRLSVLYRKAEDMEDNQAQLIVSTVVHCHNTVGRNYIRLIAPFHRLIVQSGLSKLARQAF